MSWLDDIFGQTPNAVGDARAQIEPTIAQYRAPNGSLDPNAIRDMLPKDVQGEADLQMKLAEMRRQAVDAYKPEPLKWNQWLGGALQEASIPVAYGQGNSGYGQSMLGNTVLAKHVARNNSYADDAAKMRLDVTDKSLSGIGDSALQYMQKVREKREAARQMVAKTIAVAQIRGGPEAQAQAAKSGAAYLRSLGLTSEAEALEKTVTPAAPAVPTTSPSVPSAVPGITVAPPMPSANAGPGPVVPSSPQSAAPVSVQASPMPSASPPNIISPKREIANLIRPYDEDTAKALDKEAEIDETGPLEGVKQAAKEQAQTDAEISGVRQKAAASAPKVGNLFDTLASYGDIKGMDYYTGSIQGSSLAPYTTDYVSALAPGNEATPAIRDMIKGTQMALVSLLKNNIRSKGEGSQDQREFQAVIDTIGDMTNANTVDDYWLKLRDAKARVESLTGVSIPTKDPRLSPLPNVEGAPISNEAARTSVAQPPVAGAATITPDQAASISQRYAAADEAGKAAIVESLRRRGVQPHTILPIRATTMPANTFSTPGPDGYMQ